jgi:hypothetical protein
MNTSDEIIAAWEDLLRVGPRVELCEFWRQSVPTNLCSLTELQSLLFELVALDMEFAWQHPATYGDDRGAAAKYLQLFPELSDDPLRRALIVEEFRVRSRFGDRPTLVTFLAEHRDDHDELQPALLRAEQGLRAEFGAVVTRDAAPVPDSKQCVPVRGVDPRAPLSSADYLVQRFVGAGSLGRVYVAWQHSLQRSVALKFLRKNLLRSEAAVERFLQEARLAGRVRHPGIISVHGLGRTPSGSYFLAMDLITGGSLQPVDPADGQQLRTLLDSIAQAAEAMSAAHAAGVIHCDLKPANILRDAGGRIVLTDFGLARQLSDEPALLLRGEGTPICIAPEQIDACWGPIGTATDVFNLAATLFLLLTGKSPHEGANVPEIFASAVSGQEVMRLCDLLHSLPSELVALCAQGLVKSPVNARPAMAEFARRSRELLK